MIIQQDRTRLGILLCALLSLVHPSLSNGRQSALSDQDPVIRISSNLISVPVSVTDSSGQPVMNLEAEDFVIEEDGQPQIIAKMGEPGEIPVDLALLFDVSGSIHPRFEFERQAASRFVREVLKPADSVSVFSIGPVPVLLRQRTGNTEEAVEGILQIQPTKEATAFYDTVVMAARYLRKAASPDTLRVQVVLSDGEDNFSEHHRLSDALREVQRADCLFYAINPGGSSTRLNRVSIKGQEEMEALALQTGGAAFLPDKIEDLSIIFHRISGELKTHYLLGYYSSESRSDGAFRRIVVRIPKRPDLRVRARQGYYPPKTS